MNRPAPSAEDAPVRVACFDVGGVLLRICRSWQEGCRAAGLDVRPVPALDPLGGETLAILDAYERGVLSHHDYARRLSAAIGGVYTAAEITMVTDAWILGPYEDIATLVATLPATGVVTAVLSNTCHEHWITCRRSPVLAPMQHQLASHELGIRKPDPAAFRVVEAVTGHTGASILYFDDRADNVAAAAALGWRAIRIDDTVATAPQIADALATHAVTSP
ncbi:MAG: HAD-IA family hydrolase [Phycisphaerales bacterium]|nr:HAD-IA family hydrolase [Phycisphaerae bacterium]NNF45097.1 HAD-IA family hydrolase [Phycisphaerales bacterium]NNM25139.1 HAD-IA family hydrolase [Phycisphaerales bacterium]